MKPLTIAAAVFVILAPFISHAKVIIIGAGMSGIMAGKALSNAGYSDILILEATGRIGGRMKETSFAGLTVEVGANWVEGAGGKELNPALRLAQKYGLRRFLTDNTNITNNVYSAHSRGIITGGSFKETQKIMDESYEFIEKLGETKNENRDRDVSILTGQRLFGKVPSTPIEMAIDYSNYDYEFAEPPSVTSLKNTQPLPTFEKIGNDNYLIADPRGYAYMVRSIAAEYLNVSNGTIKDRRLKLKKVVNKIKYTASGVEVTTNDGSIYTGQYCIISVSVGVLQSDLINFKPSLPQWKIEALDQYDMAIYTKIFMRFPSKFWPTGPGTEFFIYADARRGYYPIWQHLENEYPGSNVLFVTITDEESRRIEQQPDNVTKAEAMVVLRTMFGQDIPDAQDILVPKWWSDPFFKGSFSNWPIGLDLDETDDIKAPVHPLYFCGEHTSDYFNGYVHGAYYSGISAAFQIINCDKYGKCDNTISSLGKKKISAT